MLNTLPITMNRNIQNNRNCSNNVNFKAEVPNCTQLHAKLQEITSALDHSAQQKTLAELCDTVLTTGVFHKEKKLKVVAGFRALFKSITDQVNNLPEEIDKLKDNLMSALNQKTETIKQQTETIGQQKTTLEGKDKTIAGLRQEVSNIQTQLTKKESELKAKEEVLAGKRPYIVNDKDFGELRLTEKGAKQYVKFVAELSEAEANAGQKKQSIREAEQYIDAHKRYSAGYTEGDTVNATLKDMQRFRTELATFEGQANTAKAKIKMLQGSGELPES